jgi:hypothetical protein
VINNSGSWLDQNAFVTQISNDFGGAQSTFDNTGTYTKSGDATTTVDILFNNASSGGGTSNGSFLGTGHAPVQRRYPHPRRRLQHHAPQRHRQRWHRQPRR